MAMINLPSVFSVLVEGGIDVLLWCIGEAGFLSRDDNFTVCGLHTDRLFNYKRVA